MRSYQGETWMLDSREGICAGQTLFEYPATSVLFSTARPGPTHGCVAGGSKLFEPLVAGRVMGLPGGRGSPIERRDRDGGQAACPTRALRPARLAASTASPPASIKPAAKPPREARSQLGCALGSGGAGAVGWSGVPLGMEKRSRASTRRRAASAVACSGAATWPWRRGSPAWRSVASRRATYRLGRGWLGRGRRRSARRGSWLPG
jgi:hypothetical protein